MLERWYYRARKERHDPVAVLRRKLRKDAGAQAAMGAAVCQAVLAQYAAHKSWSVKLHHDNVLAPASPTPGLTPVPSYSPLQFPRRARPRQAPAPHIAPDRRRRARRSPPARSRGAQLRGRVRQRLVALGLPRRIGEGAPATRRGEVAGPVRG